MINARVLCSRSCTSADFLRMIIVLIEGQGGVTLSYVCPHCNRYPRGHHIVCVWCVVYVCVSVCLCLCLSASVCVNLEEVLRSTF